MNRKVAVTSRQLNRLVRQPTSKRTVRPTVLNVDRRMSVTTRASLQLSSALRNIQCCGTRSFS